MDKRIVGLGSGGVDFKKIVPDLSPLLDQLPQGNDQHLIYVGKRRGEIIADLEAGKTEAYMSAMGSKPKVWLRYLKQKSYKRFFGGKGSNTAYAAAKMGAKVYFFGAFGSEQDIDSTEHIQYLQEVGVIVDVQRVEGETLSQAYVYANKARQQVSKVYRGANRYADQSRIPDDLLDENTIAVGQTSVPVVQTMAFFARAKARGATVVFNCTKVDDVTREHFDLVDELVVNLDEATNIADKFGLAYGSPEALTAALAKELNVIAVVTRGGKSVLYAEREGSEVYVKQVPTPTIKPRDVTGAGDALFGSYLAFRARGRCVEQSLQLGVMAGAFTAKSESTTRPGLARAVRLARHIQRRKLAV